MLFGKVVNHFYLMKISIKKKIMIKFDVLYVKKWIFRKDFLIKKKNFAQNYASCNQMKIKHRSSMNQNE